MAALVQPGGRPEENDRVVSGVSDAGRGLSGRYAGATVLVTGAGGFVGSHLVRALVREGALVTAIVQPGGDTWRLKDIASSIRIVEQDVTLGSSLRGTVVRCA